MPLHPLAGTKAPQQSLIDPAMLIAAYYDRKPDPANPAHRVAFGTSGHRGTPSKDNFNEDHILAICQAIVEYRAARGYSGPLYIGMDTHALSVPAMRTAVEVFAGNAVQIVVQRGVDAPDPSGIAYTPTPVISHAILTYNRGRTSGFADGVVITPSHNPPDDGGFKYNPPEGGPADTQTTRQIQDSANQILADGLRAVRRLPFERALRVETTHQRDFITPYVDDLGAVVDLPSIAAARLHLGVDPLGGAGLGFWDHIAARYGLQIEIVNRSIDSTFSFMTLDHDGKIRMDCSSSYAMASLIALKDQFDIAFGNDPDYDRHGIVTPSAGLMNPNHYLAVAIDYLFQHRPQWGSHVAIGKTLVSSSMIDRVAARLGRRLCEVPVGFKYFVPGLLDGSLGFGGEESAGGSFLRLDGTTWTTDKDGFILDLLAAEILAVTGKDPAQHYAALEDAFGVAYYARVDAPASPAQKSVLANLSPDSITAQEMAGEPVVARLTHADCNHEPIGGLKVVTTNGWFAARPSGTENVYKIYAESFKSRDHLEWIQREAQRIAAEAFAAAGA